MYEFLEIGPRDSHENVFTEVSPLHHTYLYRNED